MKMKKRTWGAVQPKEEEPKEEAVYDAAFWDDLKARGVPSEESKHTTERLEDIHDAAQETNERCAVTIVKVDKVYATASVLEQDCTEAIKLQGDKVDMLAQRLYDAATASSNNRNK